MPTRSQQPKPEPEPAQTETKVARVKVNAWWCPWDDTAMQMSPQPAPCPVCGAKLDVEGNASR